MPPIDPDRFRRYALLLASAGAGACGGSSAAAPPPRHVDPTLGGNANGTAPVVESYGYPTAEGYAPTAEGYCDYATGTWYDPTGEGWWNGGPYGDCYAPTYEGGYGPNNPVEEDY